MEKLLERERELAAVAELLERGGGVLVIEGGVGIGKTSLLDAACGLADGLGHEILRARGSALEADFAFGVVCQLFERRLAGGEVDEREPLLTGPAGAVRPLLLGQPVGASVYDTSFAVWHGLYWLAANLAAPRPLLIAVDDAQWADEPSLRWLAYLAPRLEGLALVMLVAVRPGEPTLTGASLLALRAEAGAVVRPALLSEGAVSAIVRATAGGRASDELCAAVWAASGGNPLYLAELLRAVELDDRPLAEFDPAELLVGGREGIGREVLARVRGFDPRALGLAQALAVLGDGCELRHAAAIARVEMADATRLAAGLVRLEVLASDDPPRFIHPQAELADVRAFGAPRALGIASRVAGLAQGGRRGLELLAESVAVLRNSPALLERAHSLAELGRRCAAPAGVPLRVRRSLRRSTSLAAAAPDRGGPRARGAQGHGRPSAPRVAQRRGSLDPQRAARRAAGGRRPIQPRDRPRALRDAQDHRGSPLARVHQARDRAPRPAIPSPRPRKTRSPTL